ncbi:MAG: restriction endonuclease subunit S [Verrucomicrobia bacterium]|nr:restriction endonuclease subunit S [Verrucomicrobiota bacterium]
MKETKIGFCIPEFDPIRLKDFLISNDAGKWGSDPNGEGDIAVVRSTNFNDTGYLDLSDVALRSLTEDEYKKTQLLENDIVIERSGGSANQPVGRVSFITKEIEETGFGFSNFIQRIRVSEEHNAKYVFYCLYHLHSAGITQTMQTQTNGIRNLEYRYYLNQKLPKPNPTEQTHIANFLSTVDKTIQATKNSIAKLENLKTSLMQNLLTGKMKPDGSWRSEDEFWIDDKFGKVPNEFSFGRCKEFFVLQRGHDLTDNQATEGDFLVVKSNGPSIRHNAFKAEPPGVITGRSGTIGNVFFIEEKFWPHNTTLYVIDFKGNNPKFIYYLLIHLRLKDYLAGTGVPTLNRNDIHKLRVAIPNLETQNEIVLMLDSNVKSIELKIKKVDSLISLKKSLMQNLLTGKVRIPQEAFKK